MMRHPARATVVVTGLIVLASALGASGQADPIVGTFKDDRLSISLAATPTGYGGTIVLAGANGYAFSAARVEQGLSGKFVDGAQVFDFSAHLDGADILILRTGSTTYRLARQGPAAGPVVGPQRAADRVEDRTLPAPGARSVEDAIGRAKAYLYSHQENGHWDLPQRAMEQRGNRDRDDRLLATQNSSQWGGLSGLVTYTLLAAGEKPQDPKMSAALEFLKTAPIDGTYALACRLLVWHAMPLSAGRPIVELAKRDRDLLLKNRRTSGPERGLFRYLPGDPTTDHSASQFAVLGLWAADQVGAEVPVAFWRDAEATWRADQHRDGGWSYSASYSRRRLTPSMTAAGVATLFIAGDRLQAGAFADCRGNVPNRAIDAGVAWINAHADDYFLTNANFPFYTLYGVERIGLASGLKYLGTVDWYARGARALLETQNDDGSWGAGISDTCFGVLFLVRGRAPLMVNKLQYQIETYGDKPRPSNWNQRPRDAAHLSRWVSRQLEREVNWQIVNLNGPAEDLHDAPILYVAGNQDLDLSTADQENLRLFVQQGGLIVGNADCANPAFATSFKRLGVKLFPPFEFRELPAGHLIYENLYKRSGWKNPPQVQGLSNGAREFMILVPAADPARYWQTGAAAGHEAAFQLMANLFAYCSENRDLRLRGESWVVTPNPKVRISRTVKMARLRHGYNWNPEPGGWPRLAAILHDDEGIDLSVDTVDLGEGKLAPGEYALAHLTTTGRMKLKDAQRAELKAFVEAGGTLLVDAAGGDPEAADSLETELSTLVGGKLEVLPQDHAVYAKLGIPASQVAFRPYLAKRTVRNLGGPRLRAVRVRDRPGILFSPEDLSVGLVGQPIDGVLGYTPASATAIVRSVVLTAVR